MTPTNQATSLADGPYEIKERPLYKYGERVGEMAEPGQDQILTIPEVVKYLKLSRSKIYSLVATRALPSLRLGRNVRIRKADLNLWIDNNIRR